MNIQYIVVAMSSILFVTGCCKSLKMVYPNGAETWDKGNTYTIRWNSRNISGDVVVKIKGGTGSGGLYTACETVPASAGQCKYTLPCNFGWRHAVAHVSSLDGAHTDQSDAQFNIAWPNVGDLDRQIRELYAGLPYFQENPRVAQATVESFDRRTLYYFCSHLANLDNNGNTHVEKPLELQICTAPASCSKIHLTDNEVDNIHAAKAAHAVWLDKHELVPWRLSGYDESELSDLFDRQKLLYVTVAGLPFYGFSSVVDHSPSETYRYAVDNDLVKGSPLDSLFAILNDVRGKKVHPRFLHGAEYYGDPLNTAYTLYEALTDHSDRGYGVFRISRKGCHSMAPIVVAILKNLNIPGETPFNGEWYEYAHRTAVWPALHRVMPHGDDIYAGTLTEVPSEELLPTFELYDHPNPTYTTICGTDKPCISKRHRALLAMAYPSDWVKTRCCQPSNYGYLTCEAYLNNDFGDYMTGAEIVDAAQRVEGFCQ